METTGFFGIIKGFSSLNKFKVIKQKNKMKFRINSPQLVI